MTNETLIETRWKWRVDTQLRIPFSEEQAKFNKHLTDNIKDIFLNNTILDIKENKKFADRIDYDDPELQIKKSDMLQNAVIITSRWKQYLLEIFQQSWPVLAPIE